MEDILNVVRSISPDKRSFLVDASSAIGLARQMLSSYFNRREWVPAALIFITDASSTENADLVVSISLKFKWMISFKHLKFNENYKKLICD